jgi:hypothetical protein
MSEKEPLKKEEEKKDEEKGGQEDGEEGKPKKVKKTSCFDIFAMICEVAYIYCLLIAQLLIILLI